MSLLSGPENRSQDGNSSQSSASPSIAPGKSTLTARLAGGATRSAAPAGTGPVQLSPASSGAQSSGDLATNEAFALGTFATGGDAESSPVQMQTAANADNQVTIQSGQLTATGEGSDAQTRFIHWPNTEASGVTLGKGYDIGSRSAQQVIEELTAAGMPAAQASAVSRGAGLKGQAAGNFVRQNRDSIGEISRDVQYNLLATMLTQYTERARQTATSTQADSGNRNAAGRERQEGKPAGTYVMSQIEWQGLHPAMVEFLTDLIYQGGYYGWDRVARINAALKANNGNHLGQFRAVRELFTSGYMDEYAGRIGEGRGGRGAAENWYGQEVNYEGRYRRNALRLAYLNHVISALESGKTVVVQRGGQGQQQQQQPQGAGANAGQAQGQNPSQAETGNDVVRPQPLPGGSGSGGGGGGRAPVPQTQPQTQTQTQSQGGTQYVVKRGESLNILAQKFNVTVEALKAANRSKLRRWGDVEGFNAGDTITIPATAAAQPAQQATQPQQQPEQAQQPQPQSFTHVVQRGESLGILAQRFGVTIDALKAANRDRLRRWGNVEGFNAGDTITIPAGGARPPGQQQAEPQQQPQPQAGQQGGQQGGQPGSQEQQESQGNVTPPWIPIAQAEIGQREIAGGRHNPRIIEYHATTGGFSDDETPWCASFVNWVLGRAGISGTGSARALSFQGYGRTLDRPAYGSIAVFSWGGGKGHVGFVVGKRGANIMVLGGNQSNQVNVASFATSQIVAYVVPSSWQVPASAYNLGEGDGNAAEGGGVSATR